MVEADISSSAERTAGMTMCAPDCDLCRRYEAAQIRHARLKQQATQAFAAMRAGTSSDFETWRSLVRERDEVQEEVVDLQEDVRLHRKGGRG